jgi:predicted RNA-binding Zn ribbon-like protein
MAGEKSKAAHLQLLGGELCLDFANTVGNHKSAQRSDHLADYADLVAWSRHAGIFGNRVAAKLLDQTARRPAAAKAVWQRAVALREAIYRIFTAVATGAPPKPTDLDLLNEALANAMQHSRITATKDGYRWNWSDEIALDRMLWRIARSAADLLTLGNLGRVSQCGDEECGWLFVDTSKNHSRRWCDMNDCGNRAKARRHYKRVLGIKQATATRKR